MVVVEVVVVEVGGVGSVRYNTAPFRCRKCDSKSGSGNKEGKHHIYVRQQTRICSK